jgi:hypothetical protein
VNDNGNLDLDVLTSRLASFDELGLRVAIVDGVVARFVCDWSPDSSAPLDGRMHDYGKVAFGSFLLPGALVAAWLKGEGRSVLQSFRLPELQPSTSFHREPSRGLWNPKPWQWPHTRHEIYARPEQPLNEQGFMVARDDSRSFKDLTTAALHYLYDVDQPRSPASLPGPTGVIRIADTRGRISKVELSTTKAVFGVTGAKGGRIELSSGSVNERHNVTADGNYIFELPDGLPDEGLVLLTLKGDWVDNRWLGRRSGMPSDATVAATDIAVQVKAQILLGEGSQTEFKQKLPEKGSNRESLLKTVAAFASEAGGLVIVGVGEKGQEKEGELIGVTDAPRLSDSLVDLIRREVVPEPAFEVGIVEVDGRTLVAVSVQPDGRIHGIHPDQPRFFVRRGASTFPAQYAEIAAAFAATQATPRSRLFH